ncbi:hypothetical protein EJ08DRAFT_662478 [Tothia fuscella]|uniref:Uncharacterized protein n=1 Tax=Tothia fuscella TaxID=1048955 RepID=A0A9P4NMG0_9PEZI|nr:hypothetical protein EJ08DRAFT_662478 [Tothia fuscella]
MQMTLAMLSVIALTAVSAIALPQSVGTRNEPFPKILPLTFCEDSQFSKCTTIDLLLSQCYNIPKSMNNKISSLAMSDIVGCTFYDKRDCDWTGASKSYSNGGEVANVGKRNNDRFSSVECAIAPSHAKQPPACWPNNCPPIKDCWDYVVSSVDAVCQEENARDGY